MKWELWSLKQSCYYYRVWGLLKLNWIRFTKWNGHESMETKSGKREHKSDVFGYQVENST